MLQILHIVVLQTQVWRVVFKSKHSIRKIKQFVTSNATNLLILKWWNNYVNKILFIETIKGWLSFCSKTSCPTAAITNFNMCTWSLCLNRCLVYVVSHWQRRKMEPLSYWPGEHHQRPEASTFWLWIPTPKCA